MPLIESIAVIAASVSGALVGTTWLSLRYVRWLAESEAAEEQRIRDEERRLEDEEFEMSPAEKEEARLKAQVEAKQNMLRSIFKACIVTDRATDVCLCCNQQSSQVDWDEQKKCYVFNTKIAYTGFVAWSSLMAESPNWDLDGAMTKLLTQVSVEKNRKSGPTSSYTVVGPKGDLVSWQVCVSCGAMWIRPRATAPG